MDSVTEDGILKLYALKTPIKLQVIYVAWHQKQCIVRLADKNAMSAIIFVQNVTDELIIGDIIVLCKVRWSTKNDLSIVKEKMGPLLDNQLSYLIILSYCIAMRESEIPNLFDNRPFNYLHSMQIIKKSMLQFNCQHMGNYNALVKHIDMCLEAEEKNTVWGSELRQLGNKEFETKNFKGAIKFYENAKTLLNYDATIWSNSSLAYQRIGQNEKSLLDALVALKLDPFSVKAYHRASYAMKNLKQYGHAIRFIRAGIYLCGALTEFNSFFDSIKTEIADVIGNTKTIQLEFMTITAIVEQAALETKYIRRNMFSLVESLGTVDSTGPDIQDFSGTTKSLTELITDVCTTESANNWFLRHPNAFAEFMEELFIDKLPPSVKSVQKQVNDANRLFFKKSYIEALVIYTEIYMSNNPSICKSELCVLKYLSFLCNILVMHENDDNEDLKTAIWISRLLQEWLCTHCLVILGDPSKDSRQTKTNCVHCIICQINNNLLEGQEMDMLLRTIPEQYLKDVDGIKGDDVTHLRKTHTNNSGKDKADLVELVLFQESEGCNCIATDAASNTTDNSCQTSDNIISRNTNDKVNCHGNGSSVENIKGKNKQNNKRKVTVVKKSKNTKGKKNKKKTKKNNQKQVNTKRKNRDDFYKNSNSDSSSETADEENELECDMLIGDDISLGYNPRREGDLNFSPTIPDTTTIVTDSQMEVLYQFMVDWMNEKGAMRNDDPRLRNYMLDSFPENALSYVKTRSVEDFLVKSGRFVASDSVICVTEKSNDGKKSVALGVIKSFKKSQFFIHDNFNAKKGQKKYKYTDFIENKQTKPSTVMPKQIEKSIVNGNLTAKTKSSNRSLDDFEDELNSLPVMNDYSKSITHSPVPTPAVIGKNIKTIDTLIKDTLNSPQYLSSDDLRFPNNSSIDTNNFINILPDTSTMWQMSEIKEFKEKLLKCQQELKSKVDEVNNTQKQYNELYKQLQSVTEEFNKYKLHQRFEMKQLEEDKSDLRKLLEVEKGNYGNVKVVNDSMIKSLRNQVDVLTFKCERSNNEVKDKNTLVDHGTRIQTELMKRLRKADRAYLTLRSDVYDYICNREINRLDTELKALNFIPASSLNTKILTNALLLWPRVKSRITNLLQVEQKKIQAGFDSLNSEKYNPIEYSGIANLVIPDANLAMLFEQPKTVQPSIQIATPTHVSTPTRDTASPARSPFTTAEISLPSSFSAHNSIFVTSTVSSSLNTMSSMNRNKFGFDSNSITGLPAFVEQSTYTQPGTGELRDKIKEIWGNTHSNIPSEAVPFGVSSEITNSIIRPVPQLGTYQQAGYYNRNSPLDPLLSESYIKLVDFYTEKYRSIYTRDDIMKALSQIKENNGGRLTGMPKETIYTYMNELLPMKMYSWSAESKMRDIWSIDDQCPICLTSLSAGQKAELTCGHAFHKSCLTPWTKKNNICPTCRKVITSTF